MAPIARDKALARLARVAHRQHGLFTVRQVRAAGLASSTFYDQVRAGRWELVAPRVYRATVAAPLTWVERLAAACLSKGAVAARSSAAALYGLVGHPADPQVLVPHARHRKGDRSTVLLAPHDVAVVRGIRATSPARTLIDAVAGMDAAAARDLVEAAIVRRLVRVERLERRARELWAPRRRGCAVVLRILAERHPELGRARNEWEARLLRLCAAAGLPTPSCNLEVRVGDHRFVLDVAWPGPKVFIEFDGFEPHARRAQFDRDRERQNLLVAAGWVPFRMTSTTLRRGPSCLRPVAARLPGRSDG